jgi:hypothetical protein
MVYILYGNAMYKYFIFSFCPLDQYVFFFFFLVMCNGLELAMASVSVILCLI